MTEQQRLHHLLDRARRGVILPAEGEQLAALVGELEARIATLEHVAAGNKRHVQLIVPDLEKAAARVTELEAEVAQLRTTPAEHCGHQPSEVFTWRHPGQYGECVLRPGHSGSHADEHGTRWWWIDDAQPPATA